jgi:SAM-dependent methyltransferase
MNMQNEQWLNSKAAEKFLQQERLSFKRVHRGASGQMGVQLTLGGRVDYLSDFNLTSQYVLHQDVASTKPNENVDGIVVAGLEELPFKNNQFSVVVVPRLTLFSGDPHSSLREIYRITNHEGYVLLSGINAISLIGIQSKCLPSVYPLLPTVGLRQMKVWLSLLGFKVVGGDLFHYSAMTQNSDFPIMSEKIEKIGNRWLPLLAGGYWLLVKKRSFGQRNVGSGKAKRIKAGKIATGSVAKKF